MENLRSNKVFENSFLKAWKVFCYLWTSEEEIKSYISWKFHILFPNVSAFNQALKGAEGSWDANQKVYESFAKINTIHSAVVAIGKN